MNKGMKFKPKTVKINAKTTWRAFDVDNVRVSDL